MSGNSATQDSVRSVGAGSDPAGSWSFQAPASPVTARPSEDWASARVRTHGAPPEPLHPGNVWQWTTYLASSVRAGCGSDAMLAEMQMRGCPELPSKALVRDAVSAAHKEVVRGMLAGAALLAVGIGVTLFTLRMAREGGGGTYWVMWGPAIAGGWMLLRALYRWIKLA